MVVITNKINTGKKASVSSVNPWVQKLYFIYSVDRALVKIRDLESIISPNEGGICRMGPKKERRGSFEFIHDQVLLKKQTLIFQ